MLLAIMVVRMYPSGLCQRIYFPFLLLLLIVLLETSGQYNTVNELTGMCMFIPHSHVHPCHGRNSRRCRPSSSAQYASRSCSAPAVVACSSADAATNADQALDTMQTCRGRHSGAVRVHIGGRQPCWKRRMRCICLAQQQKPLVVVGSINAGRDLDWCNHC